MEVLEKSLYFTQTCLYEPCYIFSVMYLSLTTLRIEKETAVFLLLCDLLISYQQLTLEAVSHLAVQLLNIDKDAFVLVCLI